MHAQRTAGPRLERMVARDQPARPHRRPRGRAASSRQPPRGAPARRRGDPQTGRHPDRCDARAARPPIRGLREVLACLAEGIDVRSYLYWSWLDNYEWAFDYAPTFGLVAVDRQSFERQPRPSASWLGAVARAGALSGAAQSV